VSGAVATPISLATTYAQSSPGVPSGVGSPLSYGKGYEYSRTSNPTRNAFEIAVAAAEEGGTCAAFASGLAATVAILHATCKAGDAVICIDDVYGGTQRYFRRIAAPQYGIEFIFVDFTAEGALEAALAAAGGRVKLVWLETPTNPTLKVSDIAAAAVSSHAAGALLAVDNTFMSPYFQTPLAHGADFSMSSVTKYINGHSDVVGGVVVVKGEAIATPGVLPEASASLATRLRFYQNSMGAVPAPFDAYMALRGLKTLHLRMREHAANAGDLAVWLEAHPAVSRVLYPGLPSHPQHAIAVKQTRGHSGMITFYIKGGIVASRTFLESIKLFTCAESLGAVESLAESPAVMTHASVPADVRAALGISDELVRLSVGVEDVEDLRADLDAALRAGAAAAGIKL
jgi:cystathionine gamma-lyase